MIYNTGTLSVSGNTATGVGTNFTAPASQIRVGQTLLVASNPVQLFQITAISSATSLTVTPAASPALSGQKYGIFITDSLSVDGLAQSISQLINEYDENIGAWEAFATTTANQSITVTINGNNVSIPALGGLARKGANNDITSLGGLTTALSVAQGGTGGKNAADARSNLGLVGSNGAVPLSLGGTGATDAPGARANLGVPAANTGSGSANLYLGTPCFFSANADGPQGDSVNFGITLCYLNTPTLYGQQIAGRAKNVSFRYVENGSRSAWFEFYTAANTTKASDGTLKAASPVARIVKSKEECQRMDVNETGFTWAGAGTANAEAEGINISRLDVGTYVLTGAAGLASEGWQLLPPMDPGGMGELGIVEAEETESGGITVRLYKRRYVLSEDGDIELAKGVLIDVPANSWIDIRLDMPANSVWKQKQAAAQTVIDEAEQRNQENQQESPAQ